MSDVLARAPSVQQHAKCLGMLRGKHTQEAIAQATGLTIDQVASIARIHAPQAKPWKARRR